MTVASDWLRAKRKVVSSTRELRPLMKIYTKEITSKKIIGLTHKEGVVEDALAYYILIPPLFGLVGVWTRCRNSLDPIDLATLDCYGLHLFLSKNIALRCLSI